MTNFDSDDINLNLFSTASFEKLCEKLTQNPTPTSQNSVSCSESIPIINQPKIETAPDFEPHTTIYPSCSYAPQTYQPQYSNSNLYYPPAEQVTSPCAMPSPCAPMTSSQSQISDVSQVNMKDLHNPGLWNFRVGIDNPSKITKSVLWVYSEERCKLYAQMHTKCPFKFFITPPAPYQAPPTDLIIRVTALYTEEHNFQDTVITCPTHQQQRENIDNRHDANSWISPTLTDSLVVYNVTADQCYYQIVIPVKGDLTQDNIVFSCRNTCVGGVNRRRTSLLFTLSSLSCSKVLGHQVMEVRICACPGRDIERDHTPNIREQIPTVAQSCQPTKTEKNDILKKKRKVTFQEKVSVKEASPVKRKKIVEVDSEDYESITKINTSLQLARMVPEEMKNQWKENQKPDVENNSTAQPTTPDKKEMVERSCSPILELLTSTTPILSPQTCTSTQEIAVQAKSSSYSPGALIADWLPRELKAYTDDFVKVGFTMVDQLPLFTPKDLEAMNIGSGDQKKIDKLIKKFKNSKYTISSSSSANFSQPSGGEALGLICVKR